MDFDKSKIASAAGNDIKGTDDIPAVNSIVQPDSDYVAADKENFETRDESRVVDNPPSPNAEVQNISEAGPQDESGENNADNGGDDEKKEYDAYGRLILKRTFENKLRMSKNILKLNYSKVKNAIFKYKDIKCAFEGEAEVFRKGKDELFRIELKGDQVWLYCALESKSLERKVYPHRPIKKGVALQGTESIMVIIRTPASLKRNKELINLVMDIRGILTAKVSVPVAYAEKYPVIENAVLEGGEDISPEDKSFEGEDYKDAYGEITAAIVEEKIGKQRKPRKKPTGEAVRDKRRQTAKTITGAVALNQPIVYFFAPAVDKENNLCFIDVQQVLNDKFIGKMIPQQYFAVAEGSERIIELNMLALAAAVAECNQNPDKKFMLTISCRLLIKAETFNKILKGCETENKNLILAFDCALLEDLGETGKKRVGEMKSLGVGIAIENSENAGMKVLTEYDIDYLRVDARYYLEKNVRQIAHLKMLTGYAKSQGIKVVCMYVEGVKEALFLISNGVEILEGFAVGEPRRIVQVAVKERKKLPVTGG